MQSLKKPMNKRALITGGMVGCHLADFLSANTDWDIFGMCRWCSPLDNVAHLLDRANKQSYEVIANLTPLSFPRLKRSRTYLGGNPDCN